MKVTAERIPESKVLLRIEVPPEQVEQAIEKTYRDLSRRVKIPGFRPGKAPRSLIEKYLGGVESVQREGVDRAIDDSFREALRETDTRPVGDPDISERPEFHHGEALVFEATVPVGPHVELGDYTSIRLQRPPAVVVTPEQVEGFIEELRQTNAVVTPVERGAVDGDRVTIDVLGIVDEKPTLFGPNGEAVLLTDGGREVFNVKAHDHGIDVQGPVEFAPGFDEELVGMTADSEKRFGLTLPLDFANPDLAGKSIVFSVKLHDVRERHLPELNDELAKTLAGANTVDELRVLVRSQLTSRLERESRTAYDNSLLEAVVDRSTVEVPEVMVERHIDGQVADLKAELTRAKLIWQDYLDRSQTSETKIRAELREPSLKSLRGYLVLREIARAEKIQVTSTEISREIDLVSGMFGRASKVIRERLATRDERDKIESRLLNAKILERVAEIAQQSNAEIDVLSASELPEPSSTEDSGSADMADEAVAIRSTVSSPAEPAESAATEEQASHG